MILQQLILWPWKEEMITRLREGGLSASVVASFSVPGNYEAHGLVAPLSEPTSAQQSVVCVVGKALSAEGVSTIKIRAGRERMEVGRDDIFLGVWEVVMPAKLVVSNAKMVDIMHIFFYACNEKEEVQKWLE